MHEWINGVLLEQAWAFIIAREVEAPQRFQAIQSHRAAQAILHQQTHYVHHLLETAVVDEDDGRHLLKYAYTIQVPSISVGGLLSFCGLLPFCGLLCCV